MQESATSEVSLYERSSRLFSFVTSYAQHYVLRYPQSVFFPQDERPGSHPCKTIGNIMLSNTSILRQLIKGKKGKVIPVLN
jgi:hypothetical protein